MEGRYIHLIGYRGGRDGVPVDVLVSEEAMRLDNTKPSDYFLTSCVDVHEVGRYDVERVSGDGGLPDVFG